MLSSSLPRELSIQHGSRPLRPSPARSRPGRRTRSREHSSTACQQANAYGDDYQDATNYPLVQIVNTGTGHVFYAKTHGHSTMGVATGSTIVSTNFDVPAGIETGASSLFVIANGIPSAAASVTVGSLTGSFTLAATPKKASIAPGGHGNVKITATASGGFTGTIALSASGQPSGVKVVFKPTSITGGSGTAAMQVSVSSTAAAGTYTITIKGTSGSTTATTTFTLTIT